MIDYIDKMNALGRAGIPFFFMIDYEQKKPVVYPLSALPSDIYLKTGLFKNAPQSNFKTNDGFFRAKPITFSTYNKAFLKVKQQLLKGNTYLLNLTFKTPIETNLGFEEIFLRSESPYKLLYKNKFVCFSPESFIKIENGIIISHPMKGTIDASIKNAKALILKDIKELAEHVTIVDLIRNDLNMVAKNVRVENFRYVESLKTNHKTLLQVSSKVSGILPKNYAKNIGSIIAKLLPAGSICGAPKRETLNIINRVEHYKRGYYTGIMGVFDGKNLDSAVLIRFIENQKNQLVYKSGGGITHLSKAETEYQELINKVYVPFN